jgi:hypothetical protein
MNVSKALLQHLVELEKSMWVYLLAFKKIPADLQSPLLKRRTATISDLQRRTRKELVALLSSTPISTKAVTKQLEQAHTYSPEELTTLVQETWPDYLPTTIEIIENCYLVVYNVVFLTYDNNWEPIPFAINE